MLGGGEKLANANSPSSRSTAYVGPQGRMYQVWEQNSTQHDCSSNENQQGYKERQVTTKKNHSLYYNSPRSCWHISNKLKRQKTISQVEHHSL